MKLSTICTSCGKQILIRSNASTRIDLEMQKGESFSINCKECGSNQRIHINDVEASASPILVIITMAIAIILTMLFWNIGFIAFVILALPILIWQAQQKACSGFNSYKRPRK